MRFSKPRERVQKNKLYHRKKVINNKGAKPRKRAKSSVNDNIRPRLIARKNNHNKKSQRQLISKPNVGTAKNIKKQTKKHIVGKPLYKQTKNKSSTRQLRRHASSFNNKADPVSVRQTGSSHIGRRVSKWEAKYFELLKNYEQLMSEHERIKNSHQQKVHLMRCQLKHTLKFVGNRVQKLEATLYWYEQKQQQLIKQQKLMQQRQKSMYNKNNNHKQMTVDQCIQTETTSTTEPFIIVRKKTKQTNKKSLPRYMSMQNLDYTRNRNNRSYQTNLKSVRNNSSTNAGRRLRSTKSIPKQQLQRKQTTTRPKPKPKPKPTKLVTPYSNIKLLQRCKSTALLHSKKTATPNQKSVKIEKDFLEDFNTAPYLKHIFKQNPKSTSLISPKSKPKLKITSKKTEPTKVERQFSLKNISNTNILQNDIEKEASENESKESCKDEISIDTDMVSQNETDLAAEHNALITRLRARLDTMSDILTSTRDQLHNELAIISTDVDENKDLSDQQPSCPELTQTETQTHTQTPTPKLDPPVVPPPLRIRTVSLDSESLGQITSLSQVNVDNWSVDIDSQGKIRQRSSRIKTSIGGQDGGQDDDGNQPEMQSKSSSDLSSISNISTIAEKESNNTSACDLKEINFKEAVQLVNQQLSLLAESMQNK